jgi:alpha-L-fucosidase
VVPLCDTSIRPGWFYHPDQDHKVKSPQELVDLYYRSVGRNCVLLLNIPPDQRGLFHEDDVNSLEAFRRILDETFASDLALGARAEADHIRGRREKFSPSNTVDGDPESYWAVEDGVRAATLGLTLSEPVTFDRILLQEPIWLGQRISHFSVEVREGGEWVRVARATTIGFKRLLRIPPTRADGVRIRIEGSLAPPALSRVGIFKASPAEG